MSRVQLEREIERLITIKRKRKLNDKQKRQLASFENQQEMFSKSIQYRYSY